MTRKKVFSIFVQVGVGGCDGNLDEGQQQTSQRPRFNLPDVSSWKLERHISQS